MRSYSNCAIEIFVARNLSWRGELPALPITPRELFTLCPKNWILSALSVSVQVKSVTFYSSDQGNTNAAFESLGKILASFLAEVIYEFTVVMFVADSDAIIARIASPHLIG